MKALVVDDNLDALRLLVKQLRAHGIEVTSAHNGVEALQQALARPPDIIVADILMPEMDGFQLCHQWKQDVRLKAIPSAFVGTCEIKIYDQNSYIIRLTRYDPETGLYYYRTRYLDPLTGRFTTRPHKPRHS